MGILDFVFGKSIKINHSFFGQMLFVQDKKDASRSYFECSRFFRPSNKEIEIGINGTVSGPTQLQNDFFKSVEENYAEISKSVSLLIEDQFQNWKQDFKIVDFKK